MSDEDPSSRSEGRGERLVPALDRRLPVASAGKEFLRKAFPGHWSAHGGRQVRAGAHAVARGGLPDHSEVDRA
ncbi:hypothetical protein [Streptomyces collinus]|uniref:hypothetical protein n=1 Tax=Streptomyces collinus TaxID=42684 RepID=UPI0033CA6972